MCALVKSWICKSFSHFLVFLEIVHWCESCFLSFKIIFHLFFHIFTQSKGALRPKSDDVDGVMRLPLLDNKQYSDLICELGGMLSIANKIDNIHKIPWIGFQSWRAVGRKVCNMYYMN